MRRKTKLFKKTLLPKKIMKEVMKPERRTKFSKLKLRESLTKLRMKQLLSKRIILASMLSLKSKQKMSKLSIIRKFSKKRLTKLFKTFMSKLKINSNQNKVEVNF